MFTQSQTDRIAKRCATAITQALEAFPGILARAEPEAAARVIADIIKVQLARPLPETDPAAQLVSVIKAAVAEVTDETQDDLAEQQTLEPPAQPAESPGFPLPSAHSALSAFQRFGTIDHEPKE